MSVGSPVPEDVQRFREAAALYLAPLGLGTYADQHVVDGEERGRLDEIDAIIEEASDG